MINAINSPGAAQVWIGTTAQNALRAVLYLAGNAREAPVRVDQIAGALDLPRNYLSKTLHALVRAGVLKSGRGPRGGFQLAEFPERLPLARVIAPFRPVGEQRCLMGRPDCGGPHPCAAHFRWGKVASAVEDFFERTTVSSLLGEVRARPQTAPHFDRRPRTRRRAV
jgi:Rrf2 family iron-sulfur cluster assembly transcriptional regulator